MSSSPSPTPFESEGCTVPAFPTLPRIEVRAKFFFEGDRKYVLQGVTYGPFRPRGEGLPCFPTADEVFRDFDLMAPLGINTIRIYHTPPKWFLDIAASRRIRVMVTIPWVKRVLFLDDAEVLHQTRENLAEAVKANAGHPAIMGYFIDNEIPPDLVRWYGPRKMEAFLDSMVALVKKHDPGALAAYANFPPTEYILPANVDFLSYNVYLHDKKILSNYLGRLQNLAGEKPLILSEFGMDTIRHPEEEQAELLKTHVTTVFQAGLAGTIIFSWTDEWFTDGVDVEDWAFGIVTKERRPKAAYHALQPYLANPDRPLYERFPLPRMPRVSVVVCSYNGAKTLRDCLTSLGKLDYPDYEVIFVDDGSKDDTQEIMRAFPDVRNIVQVNKGLSVARNVGIHASTGEIVAFTDSDCMVDKDWLYFLVQALDAGGFAAVGGPNISPPATDWIQATVASAPGSPSHVLLTDTVAEHVPGCNMAYWKWSLEEIGGFDPQYRKAGDDVDVCWRIMQLGHQIGFSPSAIVWHYRRFTVDAYFGQQRGYGEAEAMLRYKHLNYFGSTGSAIWHGRVYTQVRLDPFFSQPLVYHGIFGTGFFQCVYPKGENPYLGLFGSLEWVSFSTLILLLSLPLPFLRLVPLILFGLTMLNGLSYMTRARIEPKFDSIRTRLLLFYLAIMQPLARGRARHFTWLRGKRTPEAVIATPESLPHASSSLLSAGHLTFWSESGKERTDLLAEIEKLLDAEGWNYTLDTGWTDWDIHIFASRWWNIRLRTITEIYPHGRRLTRVGNFLVGSMFSNIVWIVLVILGLVFSLTQVKELPFVNAFHGVVEALDSGAFNEIPFGLVCAVLLGHFGIWFANGLRLRHRVAELVHVAAVHAGLQSVKTGKKDKEKAKPSSEPPTGAEPQAETVVSPQPPQA
ncbi:Glycosyltransferase, GT2 family [Verrucomicrobium sp. GAS474]|uniref:glycosyltransferase n=1 Tax=Verrucomicrobium sp. GAS474 TaxID=1882831 RepID=UPI00087DB04B|nr:glycosyltransferase [Verrucomicrobium sp. GAS474]SDT89280.1 Glycosyltransferase, GT2 family [Verrucomicrobium sp. GAS474]